MLTDFTCSVDLKDILYSLQSNKNVYTCIVNIYIHEDGLWPCSFNPCSVIMSLTLHSIPMNKVPAIMMKHCLIVIVIYVNWLYFSIFPIFVGLLICIGGVGFFF